MTSSGESDFVTLIASLEGSEPIRRRVRKCVIQSESSFLKEYIEDGATEIKIPLRRPRNLNAILKYIYEEKLTVSKENNLQSLWNDARILGLASLEKVCIQRLTDTISLDSWIRRLKFSQDEGCDELESNVLSFVNANFEDCCRSSSFTTLNVDQMVQILQLPTVESSVTESMRVALILDWIKANEKDRCHQAHHLLQQVNLIKMTENSLRSFYDEESAFRNWRCVSILEKAVRLKKLEDTVSHSGAVRDPLDQCELAKGHCVMAAGTLEGLRTIKQEVASEESSEAESYEAHGSYEDVSTKKLQDSARGCTFGMKQESFSPPSSSSSSVCEAAETNDNADDDPSPPKMPRLADPVAIHQPRASNQMMQILYWRQRRGHGQYLSFVILSGDSISKPQRLQVKLPYYNSHVPKLIWSEEARGLFLLGQVSNAGRILSTVRYMNGQRPLSIIDGPNMSCKRHRFQPVILNGGLYSIGGSKCFRIKNRRRYSKAEVLDITAGRSEWQWQPIDFTPMKCDLFTAAVAEGRIYMIGGLRDTTEKGKKSKPVVTNSVICYEPTTNHWDVVCSMGFPRCGHASAVVGRNIYVLGGCNLKYTNPQEDLAIMRTAEVYDTEENKWAVIAPMLRPRYGGSAVEMDGKIYVFGGDYHGGKGKIQPSVECYDPVSDSWTFVSKRVDDQGLFNSVAVICNPEHFLK